MIVKCPDCDGDIAVPDDAVVGEIVECPDCGSEFEVKKIGENVELAPAEIEGEDWGE